MDKYLSSLSTPFQASAPLPVRNTFVHFDIGCCSHSLKRSSTCPPVAGSENCGDDASTAMGQLSSRSSSRSSLHSITRLEVPTVTCFDAWHCLVRTRFARYAELSKAMTYVLRHAARSLGLSVKEDGFVLVDQLLGCVRLLPFAATSEEVQRVVAWERKQRFLLKRSGEQMWVRANQGHSMKCVRDHALLRRLTLEDASLPDEVVHGTYLRHWPLIRQQGLKVGHRNHVHFALRLGMDGEVVSGARADIEVAIYLDVRALISAGIPLFESSNGVFLSPGAKGAVPASFFRRIVSLATGIQLWPDADHANTTELLETSRCASRPAATVSNSHDAKCAQSRANAGPWRPSPGAWRPPWMDGFLVSGRPRDGHLSLAAPWRSSPGAWRPSWLTKESAQAGLETAIATDARSAAKSKNKPGAKQRARRAKLL